MGSSAVFCSPVKVMKGWNLLQHEILPEYKCFMGSGSKLLLPDFIYLFIYLGNMVVMPTVTEQQAAATASDEARLCLTASLGG